MRSLGKKIGVALFAGWSVAAIGGDLPIPCASGTCGAGNPEVFVTSGQATYSVNGSVGTIEQLSDRAILNWQQFNVANGAKVVFKQPRDISVALNRIYDQSPSRILGAIAANGQIYLINPNGMIFGENARVNVNTLIASSLDIPDAVFNGPGLAGAINQGGGVAALSAASGPRGDIDVAHGAVLETVDGGRIFIFAPRIVNEGAIVTPGGQTILGATRDKVYLEFSTDPAVRGFLIEVGTGGEAVNLGEIIAERGNITMAGLLVRQQGVVSATTSVRENGSIRLLARDSAATEADTNGNRLFARRTGTLEIGANSTTSVLPDLDSNISAVDDQVQQPSSIELMGKQIHIGAAADLVATGGSITATATLNPDTPLQPNTPTNDASLVIDAGARLDVSGDTSTVLAMSRNQVDLDLRSNELADSPLQRGGVLQGETVSIDMRMGSAVANVDKAIANTKRGIGERLSAGGNVSLGSEGSVQLAAGSVVDISGGSVTYQSGFVSTSKLISNGRVIDIADADAQRTYSAVFSGATRVHPDWGVVETFRDPTGLANTRFEEGYVEGKDAGKFSIVAHGLVLDGSLEAGSTVGRHQRLLTDELSGGADSRLFQQMPRRGAVTLTLNPDFTTVIDVTLGDVSRFEDGVLIRPEWIETSDLGSFNLKTFGGFVFGDEARLTLTGDTSFVATAGSVEMNGAFVSPSGEFRLFSEGRTAGNAPLTLGADAVVNVAGLWINDDPASKSTTRPATWIDGGTIELFAGGDFVMRAQSLLDVSGGAWLDETRALTDGKGGLISLGSRAGIDTRFLPQAGLRGFALHQGGTLRFEGNALALYDPPPEQFIQPIFVPAPEGPNENPPFPLDFLAKIDAAIPAFFLQMRGFENYEFVSNRYGTVVAPGAHLHPLQRNFLLSDRDLSRPSGGYLSDFASIGVLPDEVRRPANLALAFARDFGSTPSGSVVVMQGAQIVTDIGGAIDLRSEGSLWIQGLLCAPAGRIRLALEAPLATAFPYIENQVLRVDSGAVLLARGAFLPEFDALGRTRGQVLGGGEITLDAEQGFVVTEAGSLFDVGGTARQLDITRTSSDLLEPVWVASDGGSIDITVAEGGLIDGTFVSQNTRPESRAAVRGGSFGVTFDPNRRRVPLGQDEVRGPDSFPDGERNLVVKDEIAQPSFEFGDEIPTNLLGRAEVSIEALPDSGFDSVRLSAYELFGVPGTIRGADARLSFESNVDGSFGRFIGLNAPSIEAAPGLSIALAAPFARVGYDFLGSGTTRVPVAGTSDLSIGAATLELIGNVIVSGFRQTDFDVEGDVRMRGIQPDVVARDYRGALKVDGNLTIAANRIYPTTLTQYSIDVQGGSDTSLSIERRGSGGGPLFSVGGSLTIDAPNIDVKGRLYAPQGELALSAAGDLHVGDGAVLSVALQDDVTLFGRTQAGIDWIYPFPGQRLKIIDRLPDKTIALDAATLRLDAGSNVDLSGGGKVIAYEFVPGPGGSVDVLDPANAGGSFVILPSKGVRFAPFEPLESASFGYADDAGIQLSGIAGLPSGEFAILPARYALLPGAILVTPVEGLLDMAPGEVRYDADGAPIVAGRFTVLGTSTGDSRYSGFKIRPATFAEQSADYLKSDAREFFAGRVGTDGVVSAIPDDAGDLSVSAATDLTLGGTLQARGASGGRAGRADLIADRIAIVADRNAGVAGYVNVAAADINAADVGSIALGGIRSRVNGGLAMDARATSVLIGADVDISRPELVLTATSDIVVENGAHLAALGANEDEGEKLIVENGAAALVVSSRDVDVVRNGTGGAGRIVLADGSLIEASGTLGISVAADAVLAGTLSASGASFTIDAQHLVLGDGAALPSETRLSGATLAALGADQLQFSSGEGLGIYGPVVVAAPRVSLRVPSIDRASDDASLLLTADLLMLGNAGQFVSAPAAGVPVGGALSMTAAEIDLTGGAINLRGFESVAVVAGQRIVGSGESHLLSSGDMQLVAPLLTTRNGATLDVRAGGALTVTGTSSAELAISGATDAAVNAGIGGVVRLAGNSVSVATAVQTRSGVIEVSADDGDAELRDGASLNVAGVGVTLGDRVVESDGGRISVVSRAGDVRASAGSELDVGAGASAKAGVVEIAAAQGVAEVSSALVGGTDAAFSVDANTLVDVAALNGRVESAGFSGARGYRQRQGDLTFAAGTAITTHRLELAADAGALTFDGAVNLTGADAVGIFSGGTAVAIGGQVTAGAGDLTLNALADGATIAIAPNASVALGDGALRLRMHDDGQVAQRLSLPAAGVSAATNLDLVTFVAIDDGGFDAADQTALRAAFESSDAGLGALRAALPADTTVSLSAIVTAPGNLAVTDDIDLVEWRFGDTPGTLGFSSGGSLTLLADISDGFALQTFEFDGSEFPVMRPTAGPSFGYAFVAGADAASADPLRTRDGVGDVTLASGTRIRAGTGDIVIRAGGSLNFAASDSILYTGGESTGNGGFPDAFSYALLHDAQYPTNGGAIDIDIGRNVVGAKTRQLISPYMARFGGAFYGELAPTMYGVVFDNFGSEPFAQNIGSFGGGAVRINAGGNVSDLSVIVPETLQHTGDVVAVFEPGLVDIGFTDNSFARRGATTLDVAARGDVIGGLYFLGAGAATISAEGRITRPSSGPGLLLATNNASFDVAARGDVWIESMFNPTMLPQSETLQLGEETSYFFSYTDAARLDARSLAGLLTFSNDVKTIRDDFDFSTETRADRALDVYPSRVNAVAFTDSVQLLHGMTLYPGAGGVELVASKDVLGPVTGFSTLYLADTDPAALPNTARPEADLLGTELRLPRTGQGPKEFVHAAVPVHLGDTTPSRIVAQTGSIIAPLLAIISAEAIRIASSADIDVGRIEAQNVNATDITSVTSGADITIRSERNAETGQVITNSKVIRVGGGGELQVVAGRSVDLGSSDGIQTSGDLDNPALANVGANISVLTGAAGDPHFDAFIDRYLVQSHGHDAALTAFVEARTGTEVADAAHALALFLEQPASVQASFLLDVFFNEIKASGIAAAEFIAQKAPATDVEAAYAQGRLAIATLFPEGPVYAGDLRLFFSQIATLDGGDIKLVVPGGIVNAGLATSSISSKRPSDLGIVAQREGNIDVYASGDVLVNQSRVFTLAGGDINMWSSNGNIDAGRGAKTALSTPGLSVVLGENDSVQRIVPPDISGSGIAAAAGPEGELPDIILSTPNGFVDAGDAGIRTPGRLFTAATEFLGRDNVDVGSFVGAPVGTVSLSADLAGVGNSAASASQSIAQAAVDNSEAASSASQSISQAALGWLEVFLEGYGDPGRACDADKDPACRDKIQ